MPRISPGVLTLNPQVRLEICHQKRCSYTLADNIAGYQGETRFSEFEEIEVIAPHLASLYTHTREFKRSYRWQNLREKPCLNLFGNFEFICAALFGLELAGDHTPLNFDLPAHLVKSCQRE